MPTTDLDNMSPGEMIAITRTDFSLTHHQVRCIVVGPWVQAATT